MLPRFLDLAVARVAAAATATALVLLGLPIFTPGPLGPSMALGATHVIDIGDGFFSPASLRVTVGDTVTWTNVDDAPHTVTANGAFDSGNLNGGQTFSHTFDATGTFTYVCLYHEEMVATITVVAASSPPSAPPARSSTGPDPTTAPPAATGTGTGQPDTALPVSTSPAWMAPLLIGLGLLALGVGLVPVSVASGSRRAGQQRRAGSGWRR